MNKTSDIDVIIVGAGPSGISCAIELARKKRKVLVIEKASDFGVKNMYGGEVYINSIKELLPETFENLPYERLITKHNYVILNGENSISISYDNQKGTSATITRYEFDTFLAREAQKLGVYFAPNTLCVDLIKEGDCVRGVKTEKEEIYAKIVVLAEGFNSILSEKIGLKKKVSPKSAILGLKETIKLDFNTINGRFNLDSTNGAMFQFFGGLEDENKTPPFGLGFLYTYKNFVTVGVGVSMETLKNGRKKPYEYLEKLKNHPFVSKLIQGGEVVEYSAHSIPEGGYLELPKLYGCGVLMVGDCANLVDAPHFEGTNLAIKSGIVAAGACDYALSRGDFSASVLKKYKKDLFKTYVIQDLKTYKSLFKTLYERRKTVFSYLPKKADEFFEFWTSANGVPKRQGYRNFFFSLIFKRPLKETLFDIISFAKCLWEVIF